MLIRGEEVTAKAKKKQQHTNNKSPSKHPTKLYNTMHIQLKQLNKLMRRFELFALTVLLFNPV